MLSSLQKEIKAQETQILELQQLIKTGMQKRTLNFEKAKELVSKINEYKLNLKILYERDDL